MSTSQILFPTSYMERRVSTQSLESVVVYTAETKKTYNDIFSSMADFMKSEITLIKEHKEQMRTLYPSLYARGK